MAETEQLTFERGIFEPAAAVRALRDARYRHPANAIAELIDNSWDARASQVDLLIEERQELVKTRTRWRVNKIAVADNGHGMAPDTLVQALRVGGRTASLRVQAIGKYGMGLPTASASQCQRVDVWSWQESIEQPVHSFLDTRLIEQGDMREIPEADTVPVPREWRHRISPQTLNLERGTLVVWSEIDRINAQTDTIFRRIEYEIGRTYRHLINDDELAIRMASFRDEAIDRETMVRPNDPLFLMPNSTTPVPWDKEPMFQQFGEPEEYRIPAGDREEIVEIRYSIAKDEVIANTDDGAKFPGSLPHGQHARRNMGVSIVRENRELLLENAFVREGSTSGEPRNRWWGCEIRFGAGLDDLFGVDHNKQMAAALSNAAKELFSSDKDDQQILEEMGVAEDDPVYMIVAAIRAKTRNMLGEIRNLLKERDRLRKSSHPSEPGQRTPEQEAEALATANTETGLKEGERETPTDRAHEAPEADREKELTKFFEEAGAPNPEEQAAAILHNGFRYGFLNRKLYGSQMFGVDSEAGVLIVSLNIEHPLHQYLELLEERGETPLDPLAHSSAVAIRTLLLAWARLEDQIEDRNRRRDVQQIAQDWGREALGTLDQIVREVEAETAAEEDS